MVHTPNEAGQASLGQIEIFARFLIWIESHNFRVLENKLRFSLYPAHASILK
jgi:hypothetical protein